MRASFAIVMTSMVASPAIAQFTQCNNSGRFTNCYGSDGTMTNCDRIGTTMTCNSIGGQQSGYSPSAHGGAATGIADAVSAFRIARARSRTLKALKGNNCATATREALGTADMDFARQVQAYCVGR